MYKTNHQLTPSSGRSRRAAVLVFGIVTKPGPKTTGSSVGSTGGSLNGNSQPTPPTWMSQEVSKWLGSMGYDPNISHF